MRGFTFGLVTTAIAVGILAYLLPQVEYGGTIVEMVVVALVFGVVNGLIKPVAKVLSFPISVLTLGLFGLVVNGALFLLAAWVANDLFNVDFTVGGFPPDLSVDAFIAAVIAAIVLGIITTLVGLVVPD